MCYRAVFLALSRGGHTTHICTRMKEVTQLVADVPHGMTIIRYLVMPVLLIK